MTHYKPEFTAAIVIFDAIVAVFTAAKDLFIQTKVGVDNHRTDYLHQIFTKEILLKQKYNCEVNQVLGLLADAIVASSVKYELYSRQDSSITHYHHYTDLGRVKEAR